MIEAAQTASTTPAAPPLAFPSGPSVTVMRVHVTAVRTQKTVAISHHLFSLTRNATYTKPTKENKPTPKIGARVHALWRRRHPRLASLAGGLSVLTEFISYLGSRMVC